MKSSNHLPHLLRWDLILFNRQNLLLISAAVAVMYIGVFYLLKPLGNLNNILVVLIFNEPVVTGFMFAGVIMLFEKSQNTMLAISVLPMSGKQFLWSKMLLLGGISWLTSLVLIIAAKGFSFQVIHLSVGVLGTAALLTLAGLIIGYRARTFNHFLLYAIFALFPLALPFLSLFGAGEPWWYVWLPSYPGMLLLQASVQEILPWQLIYAYVFLLVFVLMAWRLAMRYLPFLR